MWRGTTGIDQKTGFAGMDAMATDFSTFVIQQMSRGSILTEEGLKEVKALNQSIYKNAKPLMSGTMMTGAVRLGNDVWTVNVGDSRVTAVEKGQTYRLTEDTTEEVKTGEENTFIKGYENRGGDLIKTKTSVRSGHSRQIGDRDQTGCSCKAKVMRYHVPSEGTNLVLACDGVHDVLSSEDLAGICRSTEFKTTTGVASAAVKASYGMGSDDNISAMVVRFEGVS
jgi:serine/threonine protein phosphatase PrpC